MSDDMIILKPSEDIVKITRILLEKFDDTSQEERDLSYEILRSCALPKLIIHEDKIPNGDIKRFEHDYLSKRLNIVVGE